MRPTSAKIAALMSLGASVDISGAIDIPMKIKKIKFRMVRKSHHNPAPLSLGSIPNFLLKRAVCAGHRKWIGRNALCPCGSGRRFKRCHGKVTVWDALSGKR